MEFFEYRAIVTSDVQPSRASGKDFFCTEWTTDFHRFAEAFTALATRFPESEGFRVSPVSRDTKVLEVGLDEIEEKLRYG
jgi:hypothetical protein